MPIYYVVIARGPIILTSQQQDGGGTGNFQEVAHSMLPNIPTQTDARTTYTSHNYLFHVMVENGIIYMCASDPESGRSQSYAFLDEVKKQFIHLGLVSRAQFATEGELDRDFSPVLAQQMDNFSQGVGSGQDQLSTLQSQVNEVKGVMTQNIERVLDRGARLEDLLEKTDDLEASAQTFKKSATKVRRAMWWKNLKMKIILACVVILVIGVIVVVILFATKVLPPQSSPPNPPPPTPTTTKAP